MSAPSQARRLFAWFSRPWACWLAALVLLCIGCASPGDTGPLWTDPGVVRLSPDHARVLVEIHNRAETPRPISGIALRGPNWDSLRFTDKDHPRVIPASGSVVIPLEVSIASFQIEPGRYESGSATLIFASNRHEYELPIEFVGSAPPPMSPSPLGVLALLGLLALVAWGPLRARELPATASARALAVATSASLLLAAAAIPIGFGVCRGRLDTLVGPRELGVCRELIEAPGAPAIWWWVAWLTLAAVTLVLLRARSRDPAPEIALVALRSLGMTLILASLLLGLAPADNTASSLILAQAEMTQLAGMTVPRWGVFAQPLAAALAFVLVATATPLTPSTDRSTAALERLESLVWTAVLATAFLGGPGIPWLSQRPVPVLAHVSTIAIEFAMLVIEVALVSLLATRLRAHLTKLAIGPARLVAIHSRVTIPLVLLHLVLVLLWRAA